MSAKAKRARARSRIRIFGVPILIGTISLVGLIAALTGDGARDWTSWMALGGPVAAVGWAMVARRT